MAVTFAPEMTTSSIPAQPLQEVSVEPLMVHDGGSPACARRADMARSSKARPCLPRVDVALPAPRDAQLLATGGARASLSCAIGREVQSVQEGAQSEAVHGRHWVSGATSMVPVSATAIPAPQTPSTFTASNRSQTRYNSMPHHYWALEVLLA